MATSCRQSTCRQHTNDRPTARTTRIAFHFAEMVAAMMLGMMVFVPIRLSLTGLGYTAVLDGSSIEFQAWMAAFMVAPMVVWMRVRG